MVSYDALFVGADVRAIGHPFGEDWTYTRGYVSQLRDQYGWKSELGKHHVADVIQTQTPINPGNSGGPLFSEIGEVVGVTTFGRPEVGAEGINFAVHMNEVIGFLGGNYSRRAKPIEPELAINLISTEDRNLNGVVDFYVWDDNKNSKPDVWGDDENEDNFIEKIYFDNNENGVIEVSGYLYIDDKGRFGAVGNWVMIYQYDDDEDGSFDRRSVDVDLDNLVDFFF